MVSGFVFFRALAFFRFLVVFFLDAMVFLLSADERYAHLRILGLNSAQVSDGRSPPDNFKGFVASSFLAFLRRWVLLLVFFDAMVFLLRKTTVTTESL